MNNLRGIIRSLPEPQRSYLVALFKGLPPGAEEALFVERVSSGHTLLRMHDAAATVFILLEGRVKALNERYSGDVYAFAEFCAPSLFGEFEAFAGCDRYRGTLVCAVDCVFLALPTAEFLAWMRRDREALFMRTEQITKQLLNQASSERRFRFSSAWERVILYLSGIYAKTEKRGICRILASRQEIADETGFSVKTVQRCLRALREEGLVSVEGRSIVMDASQNKRLLERLSETALET